MPDQKKVTAYVLPMALFLALLALKAALKNIGGPFWLSSAEYWIYPTQTILCGALLIWFRRDYPRQPPTRGTFGVAIGILVFLLWISPQEFLGFRARTEGFNPEIFAGQPVLYFGMLIFRFLRLVIVVPFMEELFWRGFLLRYLINENFDRVPFGAFSWLSFGIVAAFFGLAHYGDALWPPGPDFVPALLTGMLYNGVAYRTKNLFTCILTHATTNLLLGLWIMKTGQWGFW